MVRGKPAFERILWAFHNVLDHSVAWLFYGRTLPGDGSRPINIHQPKEERVEATIDQLDGGTMPDFPNLVEEADYIDLTELLEWLTLAANGSPRMLSSDKGDQYLRRYEGPPSALGKNGSTDKARELMLFRWHAFVPASSALKLFLTVLKAAANDWFAFTATAFNGGAYTILGHDALALIWEYTG
ncbi:hypothetical protein BAUCODRAFT_202569 [Baudoinia panamericana UAMH 10762]|uniref:Uncharacterized protein n=1 Tax=Baudoinia panamericana (strain UAMH 10762) TaxID=717646 RepID=M2NAH6_BAUPA|nr:uncharacterized protein BAUCODRAFT_202569 [Baudoinia panamericana UAMH 10762]EMD01229.1 hypothetical protein BAUCODRAFT_202569 [Baudoinia panamericana UAMH 10762]